MEKKSTVKEKSKASGDIPSVSSSDETSPGFVSCFVVWLIVYLSSNNVNFTQGAHVTLFYSARPNDDDDDDDEINLQ